MHENPLSIVSNIVIAVIAITLAITMFCNVWMPMMQEVKAQDAMHAGEIVDKKVINANAGLFSSNSIDYRLVIQGEYEYKGKMKEVEKSISVDKETYQQANIGDWFDSHTLKVTEKNEK